MKIKMGKYLCTFCPDNPRATKEGYVYTHVLVAEQNLGRYLRKGECVHHVDGNKLNNSPDNLIVFKTKADHTAFHKGANIIKIDDVYVALPNKKSICPICGKPKDYDAKMCLDCNIKRMYTVNRPSRDELKILISSRPFTVIGEMFGVTDNAIRNWCKAYNLPSKKTIINSYSEKEWEFI